MSYSKTPSVYISSIAFNGSNFACLDSNGVRVFLLDRHFNFLESINLKYKYSSICYDVTDNCYWAIANKRASTVYQLDNSFKEINKIYLKRPTNINAVATTINYNQIEDTLWISFSTGIGWAKKGTRKINYTDNNNKQRFNKSILSLPNGELISYSEDGNNFLEFCNENYCKDIIKLVPEGLVVEDMCIIAYSEEDDSEEYTNCALLFDKESNKVFGLRFCLTFCEGDLVKIEDFGIEELDLVASYDDYYEELERPSCNPCIDPCDNPCDKPCYNPCKEPCDKPCSKPCYDPCEKHCDPCKKPSCDPCKDYKCYCDAKSKIMQSIALEEAGLAHILNAEGEKIQKAVAEFESTDKLIAVNESVKDTIIHITQLETQLYLKLESVRKDKCKHHHKGKCDYRDC